MVIFKLKFIATSLLTCLSLIRHSKQCVRSESGGPASYMATAASQQFSSNPIQVIQPENQMIAPQVQNIEFFGEAQQMTTPQSYPLRECYTGDSNYMCCNRELEDIIKQTYFELSSNARFVRQVAPVTVRDNRPDGNPPVQAIADRLQAKVENRFNTTFEIIVGRGDYASKSRFFGNFICKVAREKRFILAYGTPKTEFEPEMRGPLQENGFFSSKHRIWIWK